MKYMTFRASCAFAGLANMLSCYGLDTSDREIALGMKLPYLFAFEDGICQAGPMLQKAAWFDLYLKPRGFHMVETWLPKAQIPDFLAGREPAMLGLKVSETAKHAVVYQGTDGDRLRFLNNKWAHEEEPDTLLLSERELPERLEEWAVVAVLQRIAPEPVDVLPLLEASVDALWQNLMQIQAVCREHYTVSSLQEQMNTVFRALLLDGITMLELLEERELAERFRNLQRKLLTALRQNGDKVICLADWLPLQELEAAVMAYQNLIKAEF